MSDYIANREVTYKICPKCKKRTLKVTTWEEHLEGWGFDSYRTETFAKCECSTCNEEFMYDEVIEAEVKR